MNWTEKHTDLRTILAQLYLERADALRIVDQIGMNPATLSFSDRAINTWHEIITRAAIQGRLVALIVQALGEYPGNSTLQEALDFFQKRDVFPATKEAPMPDQTTIDRVRLRQIVNDHFNDEQLRDLLFEMNWDYENLPGTGKSAKARELIAMAERYQRLPELIAHIKRLRPQITW